MKTLLIVIFSCLSVMLYGAYQYNTKGNQSWLTFDTKTILTLDVYRSGKDKEHENFIDKGKGIEDWGWYNLITDEIGSFKNNNEYTFTENDKIALWIKDSQGNIYNSTKQPSEFIWGKSDFKDDIFKVYGGNKGSNGTHEYYIFSVKVVSNNDKKPTGQPLPGIVATLIVGGTSFFYLKKRKRLMNL